MWRSALLYGSRSNLIRQALTRSGIGRRVATRFVAGEGLFDAIAVATELNRRGVQVQIDHLGENVTEAGQADAAVAAYLELLDRIAAVRAEAHVSLKLTQMGLDLSLDLCRENVEKVAERAAKLSNFLWIDMESSDYTDRTLQIYRELRARLDNVGVAIQAYLHRSKEDVQDLIAIGGTVRLCKGAYMESPQVVFPDKRDVDRNFAVLSEMLLCSRRFHAIATHDEKMIDHALEFARSIGLDSQIYEFQLLYGVRRDLQEQLRRDGHRVRVYVPYGREWYPYFTRRLAERPANLLFLVSSLLKEARART